MNFSKESCIIRKEEHWRKKVLKEEGEKVVRKETCFNPDGKEEKSNIFFSFTVFPFKKT